MKAADKSAEHSSLGIMSGLMNFFDNFFWAREVWDMKGHSGYWGGERLITDIAFAQPNGSF